MLNARPGQQERESQVIARAGMPGAITLATNMAGAPASCRLNQADFFGPAQWHAARVLGGKSERSACVTFHFGGWRRWCRRSTSFHSLSGAGQRRTHGVSALDLRRRVLLFASSPGSRAGWRRLGFRV